MNIQFDEFTKGWAQSVTRRAALNKLRGHPRISCLVMVLMALISLASEAQIVQPELLFDFPYGNSPRGPEYPCGNLVQGADGDFYGTSTGGGTSNLGTVFKVTANGEITTLASFNNTNGAQPYAGLTPSSDGSFYGTTSSGGTNGLGTIFRVTADGALSLLVTFNNTNGAEPQDGLTLGNDDNLYGTTSQGGTYGYGTVFRVTTNGVLTTLVSFDGINGAQPYAALTLGDDGNFYGTTSSGGNGYGTVFRVNTNGELTTLAFFDGTNGDSSRAALTLGPDGCFYGTTLQGSGGYGTVFKVTTNGVLTRIAAFNGVNGFGPLSALTLGNDGNFYGTTGWGGNSSGYGTIFKVTTNGTLTRLLAFTGDNGIEPHAGLTLGNDGVLYGTTAAGGGGGEFGNGAGVVFKITSSGTFTKLASLGKIVGAYPGAMTLGPDGLFYGTSGGGSNGFGMVFKVTTNGGLTSLASFNNANGAYPQTALTLGPDGNFYGTTSDGGSSGAGTVYKVTTNGTLTRLVSFTGLNGASPRAALRLANDGNFYGTTSWGGGGGAGTVFRMTTNGVLTTLVAFNNTNGAHPVGALTLGNDGSFYGTTWRGGNSGSGTVFKVTTNGTLTTLYSFSGASNQFPQGALTQGHDGNFYGLTGSAIILSGSATPSGLGTVFEVAPSGELTTLVWFRNEGDRVLPNLTLGPDGNFYGVTPGGSSDTPGTVFQVTTNGTFATLFSFANTNGAVPLAPLTVGSDGNLYGTTDGGGSQWEGTIFRIRFAKPMVLAQPEPASQVVQAGVDISLETSIFGALPMSAQWYFNDESLLPGETNTWLRLSYITPDMSGNYSLRVTNSLGTASSSNAMLTVPPALITGQPVTGITATDAVLNGSVTIGANDTLAWFEWGTDTNYGHIAGVTTIPGASGTATFSAAVTGLDENLVYHYRIVTWNTFGFAFGPDQSFQVGAIYAYAQSVLADHPLLYYRFEETNGPIALNSGFLGEAGNATYNDTVSLGNPSLVPRFGYAAGFNNTNSGVAVPALGTLNQFTIEVWAKPRSFSLASPGNPHSQYNSIYTTDDWVPSALHTHFVTLSGHFHQWQLAIDGNGPIEVYAGDQTIFPTNGWVQLAAAYDSTAQTTVTYVNGRPFGTNTYSTAIPVNLAAAHIGAWIGYFSPTGPPSTPNWFDGEIDEFAIYGTTLPADRIQAHYQTAIGNPVLLAAHATNRLTLSWAGPGFRLESNPDISDSAGWTPVIGGNNSPVTVPVSNSSNQYFRLNWP